MKNNFIYGVTEVVMSALVDNGIAQYFLSYISNFVLRPFPRDERVPEKFNIEDLEFGFFIFLVCCAASIFVFVAEIIVFHIREFVALKGFLRTVGSREIL